MKLTRTSSSRAQMYQISTVSKHFELHILLSFLHFRLLSSFLTIIIINIITIIITIIIIFIIITIIIIIIFITFSSIDKTDEVFRLRRKKAFSDFPIRKSMWSVHCKFEFIISPTSFTEDFSAILTPPR